MSGGRVRSRAAWLCWRHPKVGGIQPKHMRGWEYQVPHGSAPLLAAVGAEGGVSKAKMVARGVAKLLHELDRGAGGQMR